MEKKKICTMVAVVVGMITISSCCQAEDNANLSVTEKKNLNVDIVTNAATEKDINLKEENLFLNVTAIQQKVHSPLQVMISFTAVNKEEAVLAAKKKAICKAVQYLQEKDLIHEYSAKVFTLADDYDKFILACNTRLEKSEADVVTITIRADLNRELLQKHMDDFQIVDNSHSVDFRN